MRPRASSTEALMCDPPMSTESVMADDVLAPLRAGRFALVALGLMRGNYDCHAARAMFIPHGSATRAGRQSSSDLLAIRLERNCRPVHRRVRDLAQRPHNLAAECLPCPALDLLERTPGREGWTIRARHLKRL